MAHQLYAKGMLHKVLDPAVIKYRAHQAKVRKFQPKLRMSIDTERYIIQTAQTQDEFEAVLRLRYEVFIREGLKKKWPIRVDVDTYDFLADHLLIIDRASQQIVGTYRLISSSFSKSFYSESEFFMPVLKELDGNVLELGRACTAAGFRSGMAIALLWKGIGRYIQETQSKYLFGCASIKVTQPQEIAQILRYFQDQNVLDLEARVHPRPRFEVAGLRDLISQTESNPALEDKIPGLMKSYFKVGARILGMPALDKQFQCADFLTLLDTASIAGAYEKKYLNS
jgi:putative hemolysin